MKTIVLLAGLLTLSYVTYGCLNGETTLLKNGTIVYEDFPGNVPYGHEFYVSEYENNTELAELDSLFDATKDFDYLSDKGVLLIILEHYKEAIALYLDIEKRAPGRYSTASNIGTAYELAGQNEDALKWITRAIEIDASSHHNSEWIHVKILEAKIKGDQYITTQHLLNTDFGDDDTPVSELSDAELEDLSKALFYQLNERVSFVQPQDKIVAQLLFDLGNMAFLLGHYKDAAGDYDRAKLYGFNGALIESRLTLSEKNAEHEAQPYSAKAKLGFWGIAVMLGVVAFAGVVVYRRRSR
ncbi:hypothetical protein [Chryseolinea lacunae]|uniref:Tetratricopeptide repeat protein n=1 Tax=Chryseolinea lacunae TaxID=2801331 RepID=A0ABS1L1Q5_9BACT|nr:hypothetical protein [Chryseolinea lacunae]MBL0745651.1 hypothetical protein [Chryseolinea lacunae]